VTLSQKNAAHAWALRLVSISPYKESEWGGRRG